MLRATSNNDFRFYMHDGTTSFSFELSGRISDRAAHELELAWNTASSTAGGQTLIVDLSYATQVDEAGRRLLRRWYDAGAQLVANQAEAKRIVASIPGQPFGGGFLWRPLRALAAGELALADSTRATRAACVR